MREPTKAMIAAGCDEADEQLDSDYCSNMDGDRTDYSYLRSDAAKPIWQAMIDAALRPDRV